MDEYTPPVAAASRAGVIATRADVIARTTTRPTISARTVPSRRRHARLERVVFAAPGPPALATTTPAAVMTGLPVRRMSGSSRQWLYAAITATTATTPSFATSVQPYLVEKSSSSEPTSDQPMMRPLTANEAADQAAI